MYHDSQYMEAKPGGRRVFSADPQAFAGVLPGEGASGKLFPVLV
jgi:hypothetical protein